MILSVASPLRGVTPDQCFGFVCSVAVLDSTSELKKCQRQENKAAVSKSYS